MQGREKTLLADKPPYSSLFYNFTVVGKIPVDARESRSGMLSISGHKLSGPLGIGALIIRKGIRLHPLFHGGPQEKNRRGGTENVADVRRNGHPTLRLPNTSNLSFLNVDSDSLLSGLDQAGITVSSGSACSSGALKVSHVLTAMGSRATSPRTTGQGIHSR